MKTSDFVPPGRAFRLGGRKGILLQSQLAREPNNPPLPIPSPSARRPPYIRLDAWDGDLSSWHTFINQLQVYVFFHASDYRNDNERILWALSFFRRYAAEEVGGYVKELALRCRDGGNAQPADAGRCGDWKEFVEVYTHEIALSVAETRSLQERTAQQETARPEGDGGGVMVSIRRALRGFLRWIFFGAIFVLVLGLLKDISGLGKGSSNIVWVKNEGVRPNRGYFVTKE